VKVLIFYRPDSEHARLVEEFVHDFTHKNPERKIELVNVDAQEGIARCELYGVVNYPTLIATTDSGELLQIWPGGNLPLMNEVAYYAQS